MRTLDIQIVSDITCPWCLIGSVRLEQALAQRPQLYAQVRYRAYLLDPALPDEGEDLRDRLERKYGAEPAQMFARVEAAALRSGITLDFSAIQRAPNTLRAHILLRHAVERGTQPALARALFEAYFFRTRDIGTFEVLADVAKPHGFDASEVERLLKDPGEHLHTRAEADAWRRSGVDGVPYFIFGGRLAVAGAHEPDTLVRVIDQALCAD